MWEGCGFVGVGIHSAYCTIHPLQVEICMCERTNKEKCDFKCKIKDEIDCSAMFKTASWDSTNKIIIRFGLMAA